MVLVPGTVSTTFWSGYKRIKSSTVQKYWSKLACLLTAASRIRGPVQSKPTWTGSFVPRAIARTVLYQPNILMCNEPFSALDSKVLENTKDFIKSYVIKNQIPCLVVSHNNEAVGDNFFDEEIVIG